MVFRLNVGSNLCQDSGSRWGAPSPLHMHVYSYLGWDKLISFYNSEGPQTGMWSLFTDPSLLFSKPTPQPDLPHSYSPFVHRFMDQRSLS